MYLQTTADKNLTCLGQQVDVPRVTEGWMVSCQPKKESYNKIVQKNGLLWGIVEKQSIIIKKPNIY